MIKKLFDQLKRRAKDLKNETYTLYIAYGDKRTPWYAKVFAGLVVAYLFSPIDLIPDFIPVLGYLDDLILVPLGIKLAMKMIPPEVMAESREKAKAEMQAGKPVNWLVAVIIIMIWIGMAFFGIRWLYLFFHRK